MTKPQRLQLSRRKGYRLQEASRTANGLDAIIVARPGRWGNPFVIGRDGDQARCVVRYRAWIGQVRQKTLRDAARQALRGHNLACWCAAGTPCHGDVLLALANGHG